MKRAGMNLRRFKSRFYIRFLQLLALCGFGFLASCVKDNNNFVVMYGVEPTDGVRFYGTIRSEDSLKNIPGLRIRLINNGAWDSTQTTTDAQGQYSVFLYAYEGDILKLKIFDIDSAANAGYFKDKVVDVEVNSRDVNNSERNVDVLLQKK
jgi:hypothetical protein